MATVAAYIDGFNLYYGMKKKYGYKFLWLDVVDLVRRLRPLDQIVVVRYFSAIVKNEPAASGRQREYQAALRARNGDLVATHLGRFNARTGPECGSHGRPGTTNISRTSARQHRSITAFDRWGTGWSFLHSGKCSQSGADA